MSKRDDVLRAAEELFYEHGFHATSIDTVVAAAQVTPRTLYHHFPSKDALVVAVLRARDERFARWLDEHRVDEHRVDEPGVAPHRAVLAGQRTWGERYAPRGCMFLRALGERSAEGSGVAGAVAEHKQRYRRIVGDRLGDVADDRLDEFLLVLEGATAAAVVVGTGPAYATAGAVADRIFG